MTTDQADLVLSQLSALSDQLADLTALLARLQFISHIAAFACCMLWGSYMWRMIVLAKNQRGWW